MIPKISVIIPVYNAEKYLHQCIDSVLNQKFTDFEILLINDGSKDRSGEICDEYAKKDKRIKVFHKENGGVSSARNLGLDNAKGEWITFVDSDDWIGENYFQILENDINEEIDWVLINLIKSYDKHQTLITKFINNKLIKSDFLEFHSIYPDYFGPTAKFYKNSFIKNIISFDKNLSYGEDTLFNLDYLSNCNKIITLERANYFYRDLDNSLSKTKLNLNRDSYFFFEIEKKLKVFDDINYYYKSLQFPAFRYFLSILNSNKSIIEKIKLIKPLINDENLNLKKSFINSNSSLSKFHYFVNKRFIMILIIAFKIRKLLKD